MAINLVIAVTDDDWFEMLRHRPDITEVNFWAPSAANFRALQPGELFLFKLHAPRNFIVGGGIFAHGLGREWEDARKFGFISAGGGPWYSRTLGLLKPGDRVWVKVPDYGFVGVGTVTGTSEPARNFKVRSETGELVPVLDAVTPGSFHSAFVDDLEKCEWFVPVNWLETKPLTEAVYEIGLFGNQNTVCRPTTQKWRHTVETLKRRFPSHGG